MSDILLAVTLGLVGGFAAGTPQPSKMRATIVGPTAPDSVDVAIDAGVVTFRAVSPGDYSVSVVAIDDAGNAVGSPITTSITVTAPSTIELNLPTSVSASLG